MMTNVNIADDDTSLGIQNISWPHLRNGIADIKCSKSFFLGKLYLKTFLEFMDPMATD